MRPIDADALSKTIKETCLLAKPWDYTLIEQVIAYAPTIDPVKHGKCTEESRYFHCSECGYGVMDVYEGNYSKKNEVLVFEKGHEWKFCPNCGAQMERSEDVSKSD